MATIQTHPWDAAEPRLNPGRLPLDYNVFVDRLGNPYQI